MKQEFDNLLVAPKLFSQPSMGWLKWTESIAALINRGALTALPVTHKDWQTYVQIVLGQVDIMALVPDMKYSKESSVSGRLTIERAPRWMYGLLLPIILMGDFERYELGLISGRDSQIKNLANQIQGAEQASELLLLEQTCNALPASGEVVFLKRAVAAKIIRVQFENGLPLYIGEIDTNERYRRLRPVLTYQGDGVYVVGHDQRRRTLRGESHIEALHDARQWVLAQRQLEIDAAVAQANKLAAKTPPLVRDLLLAALRRHKVLADQAGSLLAWQNGSHTHHGFQGEDFCYITKCTPLTATRMAQLAIRMSNSAKKGGDKSSILMQVSGMVADYLGISGIQENGDGGFTWDNGYSWNKAADDDDLVEKGIVYDAARQALFITRVSAVDHPAFSNRATSGAEKDKLLAESFVPGSWKLTNPDMHAWAIYAGLAILKAK